MKKIWILVLAFVSCVVCALGFSACSTSDKYGKEETYYSLNSGDTVYFDGKGNCNYCGLECTYEIKDGNYSIYYDKSDKTLTFKKVKDGVLVETFKDISSFLNVPVRSGYISGSITIDSSLLNFGTNGKYQEFAQNSLVGVGNYYFNDGVLVMKQTLGMTSSGVWSNSIVYYAVYVNEGTGKLAGVLLSDPDYYKQWHFEENNGDNNGDKDDTPHTLTYDLGYDGITITSQQVVKGETVNLITPERAGYIFSGWYYNGGKIESGVWEYDCDVTLTARWKPINYSITYHTDGGTLPDNYSETYTVLSDFPYTLPIPIKQGFNFAGWYKTADFSGEPITEIPENSLRNYTLYAKYTDEQLLEFELSFDGTYYSVVGYKGSPQYVTIPKTIDGLFVKEIAAKAFANCRSLIGVIMSDSVTSIGSSAFRDCSALTTITIPDSVTSIGDFALSGCSALTTITIPDSVTTIGDYAFRNCRVLTSITIPDGVTTIGDFAFYNCSALTSITIPDSVTSIGGSAFSGCSALESVTIGNGVTTIDSYAFSGCSALKTITIPDGVTTIGAYAFRDCSALTTITIPDSVTSIGNEAFPSHLYKRYGGCYYLPTKSSDYGFLYTPIDEENLINVKIHTDCKTINRAAFSQCRNLTSVIIPDSVTSIGDYAFSGCSALTTITIPDSVTSIGDYAFSSCRALESVIIGNGVTTIGDYAFYYCSNLESVTIGNGVTTIGSEAFYNCSALTTITIPDSVTTIGDYAFYDCNNLQYNEYDNACYLGNAGNPYVVLIKAKDTSITNCTINSKTKVIYSWAFSGCSALTSITIPDGVTSIGDHAFSGCSALTTITIPDSVTTIGVSAFYGCIILTDITFNGTKEQWNDIEKGSDWDYDADLYTIYCTDGEIRKG